MRESASDVQESLRLLLLVQERLEPVRTSSASRARDNLGSAFPEVHDDLAAVPPALLLRLFARRHRGGYRQCLPATTAVGLQR